MYDMLDSSFLPWDRGQPRRLGELCSNSIDDGIGRHREAAVAQDGIELGLLHRGLERQEGFQLRVAVLFNDENRRMRFQEDFNIAIERKCFDTQVIHIDFLPPEDVERLANRAVATAEAHYSHFVPAFA